MKYALLNYSKGEASGERAVARDAPGHRRRP